jgi:hypothetical protein
MDLVSPNEPDIIAQAGSPSVKSGAMTPGMLTPKELVEENPFGEFNSVTRDVEGW